MAGQLNNRDIRLIVNADDYGYFRAVSHGILEAASAGAVNATGIMGTSRCLDELLPLLAANDALDAGAHLNLTYGEPVSQAMSQALQAWGGRFPGKYRMSLEILKGSLSPAVIEEELSAQIECCRQHGNQLLFLNSHQHIHMLPTIYRMTLSLAQRFNIPYVRHTAADWTGLLAAGPLTRNAIIQLLASMNARSEGPARVTCIGVGSSGRLSLAYLRKLFARLKPGRLYELMCHPGHFDPLEVTDRALIDYHAWDEEFTLLTGEGMQQLCREYGVRLTRFRELQPAP